MKVLTFKIDLQLYSRQEQ